MRHTDAGYEEAIQSAKEKRNKIPGVTIYPLKKEESEI
jgi:urocanate hydratase